MPSSTISEESRKWARVAGLLYLIVVVAGVFTLLYVPSQLFVPTDAAATVRNIAASRTLFEAGILAAIVCYVAFLVLPLALHKLLGTVHRDAATLMVVFAVVSVPMSLLNLGHKLDILSMLNAAPDRAASATLLEAHVTQSLASYRNGVLVTEVFWGLWLFPFGYLAFKSGTIPRVLGVCLMLGCVGYLINVSGTVLDARYAASTMASIISLPSAIGEIGTCLWLLVVGFRRQRAQ